MGLAGRPSVPADKSIAHRAAILAALADGPSEIVGFPDAADPRSTLTCLRALGVQADEVDDGLIVQGQGPEGLRPAGAALDCGNSGTTLRLLSGVLAGRPFESVLTGDGSLRQRPMERIAEPLRLMGASLDLDEGRPPVRIFGGRLRGITYELPVASAQVKSAIILAGLLAHDETIVVEPVPARDHTERMLGLNVLDIGGCRHITVSGADLPAAGLYVVPRDFSSAAAFLVAGAIVRPAAIELRGVGVNPTRTGLLEILQAMGAPIQLRHLRDHVREPMADLWLHTDGAILSGVTIGGEVIPRVIDELPLLAVAAAYAEGTTSIRDAAELRIKETDRIAATASFLSEMGADVTELEDGMVIRGGQPLKGGEVDSMGDHRIAMAAAVAALGADGPTVIHGADAVAVSFPTFWLELAALTGEQA